MMLAVAENSPKGFSDHFDWLNEIRNRKDTKIHITLNENPMFKDKYDNQNHQEPAYQIVVKANERKANQNLVTIYHYIDAPNQKEAELYVNKIRDDIQSIGFRDITCVLCI